MPCHYQDEKWLYNWNMASLGDAKMQYTALFTSLHIAIATKTNGKKNVLDFDACVTTHVPVHTHYYIYLLRTYIFVHDPH